MRAKEEENLEKKTALCEKIEAINQQQYKLASEWEKVTKEVIGLQSEWKKIGFAPQKMNVKIFERFRTANDEFFAKKAEYFKVLKEEYAANTEKKKRSSKRLKNSLQALNGARRATSSSTCRRNGSRLVLCLASWAINCGRSLSMHAISSSRLVTRLMPVHVAQSTPT